MPPDDDDFDDSDVNPSAPPPVDLQERLSRATLTEHGKHLAAIEASIAGLRELLQLAIVDKRLLANIERRLKSIEEKLAEDALYKGP